MRVRSRLVPRPVLSTCGAWRHHCRCRRRVSSSVAPGLVSFRTCPVVRCSWLLVRLPSLPVLLASCLSCGFSSGASAVPACYPFRPVVVSFGSPLVRQGRRGGGGLRLGMGSSRSLLPVACRGGAVDVAGRFLLCVLLFAAVSMASAGCVISVAPVACRWPLSIGSVLFSRVVPSFLLACPRRRSLPAARGVLAVACGLALRHHRCLLRPVAVVWSSWADRRRLSWLAAPSCLSEGGEAYVPSSRAARCSGRAPVVPFVPRCGSSRPVPVVFACFPVSVIMRGRCGGRGWAARVWACGLLVLFRYRA